MARATAVENVERFLRVKAGGGRSGAEADRSAPAEPFVTISSEAGAGGHLLAGTMLEVFARQPDVELFGAWQVFDQKLCEVVAENERLEGSLESLLSEEYRTRTGDFLHQLLKPTTGQGYLMERVFRTVRMLVGVGKVIIVGRGGSEITHDMGPGFSLRLVAPEAVRIQRLAAEHNIEERRAHDQARRHDAHRARLLKRHFGVDIDDPLLYDAVFNTARVSHAEIAEAVAGTLRRRANASRPS